MKPSLPNWTKKITKRMIIIWAVSFVAFLVISFGTASAILAATPKSYSNPISYANVFSIQYLNENHSKELFNKKEIQHSKPMQDILGHLQNGGKTNAFANMFRGNPHQTVGSNNTDTVSAFRNTYSKNAIIIWFSIPQYSVQSISRTEYNLAEASASTTNASQNVHAILIPLDNTSNKFQEQVWYLVTTDRTKTSTLYMSNKITTYGNYYKLGNYVKDLYILL